MLDGAASCERCDPRLGRPRSTLITVDEAALPLANYDFRRSMVAGSSIHPMRPAPTPRQTEQEPLTMDDKVIVSNRSALVAKYGNSGLTAIKSAIEQAENSRPPAGFDHPCGLPGRQRGDEKAGWQSRQQPLGSSASQDRH